ncbi:MAG: O-antigen ligase family protein, partial [Nitrososphaerales archaeon]
SMRKLSILINSLLVVYVYVAIFGLLHNGMGPGGHIGDENDLALALNMVIPYAFVSVSLTKSPLRKALFVGVFALMVFGVIATFSRGGFLGLLSVLLYISVLTPRKGLALVLVLFVSLGAWIYTPDKYWTEMGTIMDEADNPELGTGGLRRQYWEIALRMFYENPIFGVGLENYNHNIYDYEPDDQMQRVGRSFHGMSAHSLYFTLLAELGLSGSLIFAAIVWFNTKDTNAIIKAAYSNSERLKSIRKRETRPNSWENTTPTAHDALLADLNKARFYAHAMRASLLGYLTSAVFLSVFGYPHFWLLTAMIVALKEVTDNLLKSPAKSVGQAADLGGGILQNTLKLRQSISHHPL